MIHFEENGIELCFQNSKERFSYLRIFILILYNDQFHENEMFIISILDILVCFGVVTKKV